MEKQIELNIKKYTSLIEERVEEMFALNWGSYKIKDFHIAHSEGSAIDLEIMVVLEAQMGNATSKTLTLETFKRNCFIKIDGKAFEKYEVIYAENKSDAIEVLNDIQRRIKVGEMVIWLLDGGQYRVLADKENPAEKGYFGETFPTEGCDYIIYSKAKPGFSVYAKDLKRVH